MFEEIDLMLNIELSQTFLTNPSILYLYKVTETLIV
jgi:hypothetical protein